MTAPARVASVLPDLSGRGVLLAAAGDAAQIVSTLANAGFAVAQANLRAGSPLERDSLDSDIAPTSLRSAQAAIATALRLPETAGTNLDALVDSLRDLATWWPDDERVVLVLHGAESLVEGDLPGWQTLTDILREASADLWRGGETGDRAFETVALVDRHGVLALPSPDARDAGLE